MERLIEEAAAEEEKAIQNDTRQECAKLRDRYREWLCPDAESSGCCGCGGERYEVVPRSEGELSSILKGKDPDLVGQQGGV